MPISRSASHKLTLSQEVEEIDPLPSQLAQIDTNFFDLKGFVTFPSPWHTWHIV